MREIKFRYIFKDIKENGITLITQFWNLSDIEINDIVYDNQILIARSQYTGLKDKNGVEIYEGDIVKEPYYVDENNGFLILKVIFKEGEYLGEILNKKGFGLQRLTIYKEVIGNIYENHELLNNN